MTIRSIRILYTAGPPVVGIDVAFCAQQCWRLRGWPCALEDERCSDQIESRGTRRGPRRLDRLVSRTHSANELTRRARRCACGKDLPRNLHTSWLLRSGRPEGRTQHGQANEPAPPPPRAARASTTAAHCQRANLYLIYLCGWEGYTDGRDHKFACYMCEGYKSCLLAFSPSIKSY
jgi:hypothetical protein